MYKNIAEIKKANRKAGQNFFDKATLQFFGSKIYPYVVNGELFITSESHHTDEVYFTVRKAYSDGDIDTLSEYRQFATLNACFEWIAKEVGIKELVVHG